MESAEAVQFEIRYATTPSGASVAYGVAPGGPGFVFMQGHVALSNFQMSPYVNDHFAELVRSHTFVVFDHAGGGFSGPAGRDYTQSGLVAELDAVVTSAGLQDFVLYTCATDTPAAIEYVAQHPDKVRAFVIANGWSRGPDARQTEIAKAYGRMLSEEWNLTSESVARIGQGSSGGAAAELAALIRSATTHELFVEWTAAVTKHDASGFLESIQAPTLIFYTPNTNVPASVAREMASRIPNARLEFVDLPTDFRPLQVGIQRFLRQLSDSADEIAGNTGVKGQLTGRETEILTLVAGGASNGQIAERLTLSVRTVERHVANVYGKIGVNNRAEAAAWAVKNGLG